jgi:hypothetical protein
LRLIGSALAVVSAAIPVLAESRARHRVAKRRRGRR